MFLNDFTGTYAAGLYCEGQEKRSLVQSTFFIGIFVGMFLLAMISDAKGRKRALLIAYTI